MNIREKRFLRGMLLHKANNAGERWLGQKFFVKNTEFKERKMGLWRKFTSAQRVAKKKKRCRLSGR